MVGVKGGAASRSLRQKHVRVTIKVWEVNYEG